MESMKRICLLTGASGLLGSAFIERYAVRYQIIAVHRQRPIEFATQEQQFIDPLFPTQEIAVNKNAVHAIRADISKSDEIDRIVREVIARFGNIDVLINCAAVRGWSHLLAPGTLNAAEAVININILAPLRLSVAVAQSVWRADPEANQRLNRNIINISSTAGLFVYPDLGQALYGMSKAALNHLTYHLASDFWDIGIRVNALVPDTFPGVITIEEVLEAIVALDDSEQTGQALPIHASNRLRN